MQIKNKEWLELHENGKLLYGYDQDWFSTSYKRTRGCGPTAAAMQINYLAKRDKITLPFSGATLADATVSMEVLWDYFTPNPLLGLYDTDLYCLGGASFIRDFKLDWHIRRMKVKAFKAQRAPLKNAVRFIANALKSDCPVAFLNLEKGECQELYSWHWAIIVGLEFDEQKDKYYATCFDEGLIKTFDLGLWLATSRLGGGFVYMTSENDKI